MDNQDNVNLESVNAGIWLRAFKGCEHYTDDQAMQIVRTLDTLAEVMFEFTCQQNGIVIDNQLVIERKEENELKLAA